MRKIAWHVKDLRLAPAMLRCHYQFSPLAPCGFLKII